MRRRRPWMLLFVLGLGGTACASDAEQPTAGESTCPTDPVSIAVTVDQWGDIVERLAGDCGEVTTIIEGSVDDPHDYELTTADTADFSRADLVVMNGLDYDHWADDAIETLDPEPAVVRAADVVGLQEGDNPHIWYEPEYVEQVSMAVTTELQRLDPDAVAYLGEQARAWTVALRPYLDELSAIRQAHPGATFVATESVLDLLADALGMVNLTPSGYRSASANESEPAPGDINAFEQLLGTGTVDVLIYNRQTTGAVPEQLRAAAEDSGIPVVEVTETMPADAGSFVDWQLAQLQALSVALSS